jgi:2-oxoisovalerate dehydrogenase E2 component (dihydrolipoyl transacylase)
MRRLDPLDPQYGAPSRPLNVVKSSDQSVHGIQDVLASRPCGIMHVLKTLVDLAL